MTKLSFSTAVSGALAALGIGLAGPALADAGSGSSVPPPGPVVIHQQTPTSGANPHTPFGIDPYVPYGVWAEH
jgi:hypothetical protein